MKGFSMPILTLCTALILGSCNNDAGGRSTALDATNDSGKAPVEYNSSTETPTTDSTMHTAPMEKKAQQDNNANANIGPANNGTQATGNTTDSTTTSGSATRSN